MRQSSAHGPRTNVGSLILTITNKIVIMGRVTCITHINKCFLFDLRKSYTKMKIIRSCVTKDFP